MWFIFALLAAFAQATHQAMNKVFLKKINEYALGAVVFFISAIFLLIFSMVKGFPAIGEKFITAVLITGTINVFATIFFFKALKGTDVSLAIPMLSFTPAFTILTSFIILKETPSIYGIFGIILVVFGAYFLNSESVSFKKLFKPFGKIFSQKELLYALIVAFLYSVSTNYDKIAVLNSDPIFGSAIIYSFVALVLIIIALIRKDFSFKTRGLNLYNVGISGLFNALSAFFINTALTMQIVPYVSSMKRTSVLFGVMYGFILFKEKNIGKRFFGASIMFLGAVLIILFN